MDRKIFGMTMIILAVLSAAFVLCISGDSDADDTQVSETIPTLTVGQEYVDYKIYQKSAFESADIPGIEFSVKNIDGVDWIVANGIPTEEKVGKIVLRSWANESGEGNEVGGSESITIISSSDPESIEYGSNYGAWIYLRNMDETFDTELHSGMVTITFDLMKTNYRLQDNSKKMDQITTDCTIEEDMELDKTNQTITLNVTPATDARGLIKGSVAVSNTNNELGLNNVSFNFQIFLVQEMIFFKGVEMYRTIDYPSDYRVDSVSHTNAAPSNLANMGLSLSTYDNSIKGTMNTLDAEGTEIVLELTHRGVVTRSGEEGGQQVSVQQSFTDADAYKFRIKVVEPCEVLIKHENSRVYNFDDTIPFLTNSSSILDKWLVPSGYAFKLPHYEGNPKFYNWTCMTTGPNYGQTYSAASYVIIDSDMEFWEVSGYIIEEDQMRKTIENQVYSWDVINQKILFHYTDGTTKVPDSVQIINNNFLDKNGNPILRIGEITSTYFTIVGDIMGIDTGGEIKIEVKSGTYGPLELTYKVTIRTTALENKVEYFHLNQEKRVQVYTTPPTTSSIRYVYILKNDELGEKVFDSNSPTGTYCDVNINNYTNSSQYSQSEKNLDITFKQEGLYIICVVLGSTSGHPDGFIKYRAMVLGNNAGSNLYIQSYKDSSDPYQYTFVAVNADKYPDAEPIWEFVDEGGALAYASQQGTIVYQSFQEKSNATTIVKCLMTRYVDGVKDVVAESEITLNPDIPIDRTSALVEHSYDYTIQNMPNTSTITISPDADWLSVSETYQGSKKFYRISGIPGSDVVGNVYTVTVKNGSTVKDNFQIAVIDEQMNCDFSYQVTNYTLTITNANEPVSGHIYKVNWGSGNYQTYDPAVKVMTHEYLSSTSAHVSIEVYAKTPSGGIKLGTCYLKDGQSIDIGDGQEIAGHGLVIHPNGAKMITLWETSAEHVVLPECPYEWEGHSFLYYSGNNLGLGEKFMPGDTIDPKGTVELYCIWENIPQSSLTTTQILMIIAAGLLIVLIIARL